MSCSPPSRLPARDNLPERDTLIRIFLPGQPTSVCNTQTMVSFVYLHAEQPHTLAYKATRHRVLHCLPARKGYISGPPCERKNHGSQWADGRGAQTTTTTRRASRLGQHKAAVPANICSSMRAQEHLKRSRNRLRGGSPLRPVRQCRRGTQPRTCKGNEKRKRARQRNSWLTGKKAHTHMFHEMPLLARDLGGPTRAGRLDPRVLSPPARAPPSLPPTIERMASTSAADLQRSALPTTEQPRRAATLATAQPANWPSGTTSGNHAYEQGKGKENAREEQTPKLRGQTLGRGGNNITSGGGDDGGWGEALQAETACA